MNKIIIKYKRKIMMKKFKMILAIAMFAFISNANATDYKDIINANKAARGGKAIDNIKTIQTESDFNIMGTLILMKFNADLPAKYALEISQMGQTVKFASNGTDIFASSAGQSQDIDAKEAELMVLQFPDQLYFQKNALLQPNICTPENSIVTVDTLDGKSYQVLKVKQSELIEVLYYIDPATNLEAAYGFNILESATDSELNQQLAQIGENKPIYIVKEWMNVEGVKFPKTVEVKIGEISGTQSFTKIEVNKKIDAAIFNK